MCPLSPDWAHKLKINKDSKVPNPDAPETNTNEFLAPFIVLLSAYCIWVLSLPLFPSLDGSLHLYYASVLASLLSGSKIFSSYYFIRNVLPPYALHYYFLIAAAHFVGYVIADKLLVCLIFITTACGFRYLAMHLGPSGGVLSLLVVPLLLNWTLGMGFYNYCLAIGMALWALGMWYRAVDRRSHILWVGFLTLVSLMVLTHPVPTLFVYLLVGIDVAWRLFRSCRERRSCEQATGHFRQRFRWDIAYMLAALGTFAYIALFIGAHRVMGNLVQNYPRKAELISLAKLSTLAMFSGSQPAVLAYRASLYAIFFLTIVLGFRGLTQRWRRRAIANADLLLICSILLVIAIPILPPVMNGANYFSQRLVIFVWIGALAAASGHPLLGKTPRRGIAFCACAYAIAVLVFANSRIRPVAVQISQIETASVSQRHLTGLVLGLPDAPDPSDLNYVPYYWAGTRYFRRTQSILLNGGWLYQYYLPLGSRLNRISGKFPPNIQDTPGNAFQLLMRSEEIRRQVMPHADLLLFTGQTKLRDLTRFVHILDDSEPLRQWNCNVDNWYSVCTAPSAK